MNMVQDVLAGTVPSECDYIKAHTALGQKKQPVFSYN